MSYEEQVTYFTKVEIETINLNCLKREEIIEAKNKIELALEQKLNKINLLIKECNVYAYGGALLVNDRYSITKSLIEIVQAYGMNIKTVECSLKGKTYLITDELVQLLNQLDFNSNFGQAICNKTITEDVEKIILKNLDFKYIDQNILTMVKNIKNNGSFRIDREISVITGENYYGVVSVDKKISNEWTDDLVEATSNKLRSLSERIQNSVNSVNSQIRNGTVALITERARQMGYAVKTEKGKQQVQLVLMRDE